MRISDWSSDVCSSDLRHRLAGHQRLVYRRATLHHLTVHRQALAGPDAHEVSFGDLADDNLDLASVAQDVGGLRLQVEQALDRLGRAGLPDGPRPTGEAVKIGKRS